LGTGVEEVSAAVPGSSTYLLRLSDGGLVMRCSDGTVRATCTHLRRFGSGFPFHGPRRPLQSLPVNYPAVFFIQTTAYLLAAAYLPMISIYISLGCFGYVAWSIPTVIAALIGELQYYSQKTLCETRKSTRMTANLTKIRWSGRIEDGRTAKFA
jgi:hypothetical protein